MHQQHQLFAFLTGRVRLLLVHGQKLVPLVLGSDPLFPQEPACGTWSVYLLHACFNHWDAQISLGSSARLVTRVCFTFTAALCRLLRANSSSQKTKRRQKGRRPRVPIASSAQLTFRQGFRQSSGKRPFPSEASSHAAARLSFVRWPAPLWVQSKLDCGMFYNH